MLADAVGQSTQFVTCQRRTSIYSREIRGAFINKKLAKQNDQLCSKTLAAIEVDLKKVEKAIDQVIATDTELKRLFSLVTSVSGIGKVTATMIIISTNEFKDIKDPKKFACHAGVASFTKESGLFKGKARVSHMANKKLKTLLHLAAMVAIQNNEELKRYYQRKVFTENKNRMSTINAVRNKLILRVFACVNQNRTYEKISCLSHRNRTEGLPQFILGIIYTSLVYEEICKMAA